MKTETLKIQPIIVPRSLSGNTLHFCVVFNFLRISETASDATYKNASDRKNEPVTIPECLKSTIDPWPGFIRRKLKGLSLKLVKQLEAIDPVVYLTGGIEIEDPRDLQQAAWTEIQANQLWRSLIAPYAKDIPAKEGLTDAFVSTQAQATTGMTALDLADAIAQPNVATDLRPQMIIESVESGKVGELIDLGAATNESQTPDQKLSELRTRLIDPTTPIDRFLDFLDGNSALQGWAAVLSRNDPKFDEVYLPILKKRPEFPRIMDELAVSLQEFGLNFSALEIRRQSRFIQSGRNQSTYPTLASNNQALNRSESSARFVSMIGGTPTPEEKSFEEVIRNVRQHPGLMRRLSLTVHAKCTLPAGVNPNRVDGPYTVSLEMDPLDSPSSVVTAWNESPFVVPAASTLCDIINDGFSCFRAAPRIRQTFVGAAESGEKGSRFNEAMSAFQKHSLLSKNLIYAAQTDPSLAMARAERHIASETSRSSTEGEKGGYEPNDASDRVHSVNFFSRYFAPFQVPDEIRKAALANGLPMDDAEESADSDVTNRKENNNRLRSISAAEHLQRRISTNITVKKEFDKTTVALAQAVNAMKQPNRLVSTTVNVIDLLNKCEPLYYAENLMAGHSLYVSSDESDPTWRSLCRRVVEVEYTDATTRKAKTLVFEEEGFIASTVVHSPEPITGTLVSFNDSEIKVKLRAGSVDGGTEATFQLIQPSTPGSSNGSNEPPTQFACWFDSIVDKSSLRVGDQVMISPVPVPKETATEPLKCESVFIHPEVRDPSGAVSALVLGKFANFKSPLLVKVNRVHGDDGRTRSILLAPKFTRFVDTDGVEVTSQRNNGSKFNSYTVEGSLKLFSRSLGLMKDPDTCERVFYQTSEGFTRILPADVPKDLKVAHRRTVLDPDRKLPGNANPFDVQINPEDRITLVSLGQGESLEWIRGRVTNAELVSTIWRLKIESFKGQSFIVQVANQEIKDPQIEIHPKDSLGLGVELLTRKRTTMTEAIGLPRYLLGSSVEVSNSTQLLLSDGSTIASKSSVGNQTGRFEVRWNANELSLKFIGSNAERLLVGGELRTTPVFQEEKTASNNHYLIELFNANGDKTTIAVKSTGTVIRGFHASEGLRSVRSLRPGEYLVAYCDLNVGVHSDAVAGFWPAADASGSLLADTYVIGTTKSLTESAYAKSVSSANLYASATLCSDSSKDVSVWSDVLNSDLGRVDVFPTFLLMLAESLADCDSAPAHVQLESRSMALSTLVSTNAESSPRRSRAVVSEIICRWGNWSVTTPVPGGDEGKPKQEAEYDTRFKIKIRRPYWNDPIESRKFAPHTSGLFGRDQWQLPTLRFGNFYRFCFRRVDLAGNHLYDEQPMEASPSEVFSLGNDVLGKSGSAFERVSAPSAPILAHQPGNLDPQFIQLLRSVEPKSDATPKKKAIATPPQLAQKFDYLASTDLEDQLVLFSDVLAPGTTLTEDSFCEVLPPPLDVETVILEGGLDKYKNPEDAIAFIRKHESYFDHLADTDGDDTPDSFVLGRLKGGGGDLNYFPDNSARWLQASIDCPFTSPHSPAKPLTVPLLGKWPATNWVRIHLASSEQNTTEYRRLPTLSEPQKTTALSSYGITFFLPPGAEATARMKCFSEEVPAGTRPVDLPQSNERTVRLRHIANGPLIRPRLTELTEKVPDLPGVIPNTRQLQAKIELHPLTSGAVSIQGYWNDCWDESVPAQFEPARAVVEVSKEGIPIAVHLVAGEEGFGFGSQAVVLFEEERVPIRNPKLHPILRGEKLVELRVLDEGVGCGAVYRVTVLPACCPVSPHMCPAYATARRNEAGKLEITIDDPGRCLGPSAVTRLCLNDRVFPTLLPKVVNGSIAPQIDMIVPKNSRFSTDLTSRIVRRPPLARLAEGIVDPKRTNDGGIETVYVSEGGGWYLAPPICVLVDPSGDGYGAKLNAVLNSFGEVESVTVVCPGRKYSADTRVEFYTSVTEIPETIIPLPTPTDTEAYKSFEIDRDQAFPDARARRIDFVARVTARNRELLLQEDVGLNPVTKPLATMVQNKGLIVAPHGEPAAEPSGSMAQRRIVQRHVPRFSTPLQLPAVSYLRPQKPDVAYMMPAFQWTVHDSKGVRPVDRELRLDLATEKKLRVDREAVIRIYLKRPWNASGPEKLAVVLAPAVSNSIYQEKEDGSEFPDFLSKDAGVYNPAHPINGGFRDRRDGSVIDAVTRNLVSRIGFDPVWNEIAFPPLNADHFPDRYPFTCYEQLSETGDSDSPIIIQRPIQLALHDVHYDAAKELWYSDIKIDLTGSGEGPKGLPFVRLAIASYQPNGQPGRRLSPVKVCDMYKIIGKRRLEMRRTSTVDFDFSLAGEFDHAPTPSDFPMREVKVQMTLQDQDLPPEIIAYDPPAEPTKSDRQPSNRVEEFKLKWVASKRRYIGHVNIIAKHGDLTRFYGRSVYPVLHLLESEIFPVAETITDSTGTDLLMINDRPCARRLVFSAAVNVQTEKMEPAK